MPEDVGSSDEVLVRAVREGYDGARARADGRILSVVLQHHTALELDGSEVFAGAEGVRVLLDPATWTGMGRPGEIRVRLKAVVDPRFE